MEVYRVKMPECPTYILTRCDMCGKVHALRVIKLFSSVKKGRFLVFYQNNFKFYTFFKV